VQSKTRSSNPSVGSPAHAEAYRLLLELISYGTLQPTGQDLAKLSPAQWRELLNLARAHLLSPLLYSKIRRSNRSYPSSFTDSLLRDYRQNALRNLHFRKQLYDLGKSFTDSNVPFIVLKGMHLIHGIYQDPSARIIGDIDILVLAEDLERADRILRDMGYTANSRLTPKEQAENMHHLKPFSREGDFCVEVHWNISLPKASHTLNPRGIWDRRRIIATLPRHAKLLGLSDSDLMIHLAIHTTYHHQLDAGLRPLCDIAELAQQAGSAFDWRHFLELAKVEEHQRGVHLALRLAQDLVGAQIPFEVMQDLAPTGTDRQALESAQILISTDRKDLRNISRNLATFWDKPSLGNKFSALLSRWLLSKMEMAQFYQVSPHSRTLYFYYLLRIWSLLRQWGRSVFKLLRRDRKSSEISLHRARVSAWLQQP